MYADMYAVNSIHACTSTHTQEVFEDCPQPSVRQCVPYGEESHVLQSEAGNLLQPLHLLSRPSHEVLT